MLRKLAIAIAASGALMSATSVHALGMGDIELDSALNQPLDAHIKLLKAGELEDWEIKPDLASTDEFQKSGIERVFFLNNVKFEIERSDEGVFIKLSTQEAVVEPFLNFLVQVDWPNGRLLREYTLLLDPPVFAEEPSAPVQAPQTEEFDDEPEMEGDLPGTGVSQSDTMEEDSSAYAPEEEVAEAPQDDYEDMEAEPEPQTYKVRNNDTLWEVALKTRPNRSISPQQAMLAIQDLNPESFINGNINRLKKNQVLRIPSEEQINARDFREAVSEVAVQNKVIKKRNAQLDATRKVEAIDREQEVQGAELKLLTDGDATSETQRSASGEVMSTTAGDQSTLDNELSLALENLDKSQRENKELGNRLDALEEQINTLQRIINLKDEQMVALQAGFSQQDIEQPSAIVDELEAEVITEDASLVAEMPQKVSGDDLAEEAGQEKSDLNFASPQEDVKEDVKPKAKAAPVIAPVEPVEEEFDVVSMVMENIEVFGGALGALLLTLLLVNRSRKKKEDEEMVDPAEMAAFDGVDPLEQAGEELEADLDDEFADLEMGGDIDELMEEDPESVADVSGLENSTAKESENADVLGEAEIYIAYDRMDQARSLLEKTVEAQPARMDIRVKLLEVLSAIGDGESFSEHYDFVVSQGSEEDQEKANAYREALGLEGSVVESGALTDSAGSLDFNDDLGLSESNELQSSTDLDFEGIDLDADEGDLNFDLDGLGLDEQDGSNIDSALSEFDTSLDSSSASEVQDDDLSLEFGSLELGDEVDSLESAVSTESATEEFSLDADLDFDIPELSESDVSSQGEGDLAASEGDLSLLDEELVDIDLEGELSSDVNLDDVSLDLDGEMQELESLDSGLSQDEVVDLDDISLDLDADLPSLEEASVAELDSLDALDLDVEAPLNVAVSDNDLDMDSELAELDEELSLDMGLPVEGVELGDELAEVESDLGLSLDDTLADEDLGLEVPDEEAFDSGDNLSLTDNELDLDLGIDESELPSIDGLDGDLLDDLDKLSVDLDVSDASSEVEPTLTENTSTDKSAFDLPSLEENDLDLTDLDGDLDFLSGTDESETKLDLARAYIDMDDQDGAREILQEVLEDGTDQQKQDAGRLMDSLA
jgi:pilus assembly protein FimV